MIDELRTEQQGLVLYRAAAPGYPELFFRDGILAALLARDVGMLRNWLVFGALTQGTAINPHTAEEYGKIIHQDTNTTVVRRKSPRYNGCDETALYLIGHEVYKALTGDRSLAQKYRSNIVAATQYIEAHLDWHHRFVEDPVHSGARDFDLRATYWKDSVMPGRRGGVPSYPVAFYLAHVQNTRGCFSGALLLGSQELERTAKQMKDALPEFYDAGQGTFYLAIDRKGPVSGITTDPLHALCYLDPGDLPQGQLEHMIEASAELETPWGYRAATPRLGQASKDGYHLRRIWSHEQAIIHNGGLKAGIPQVQEVSARIVPRLEVAAKAGRAPETFVRAGRGVREAGNPLQLWAWGALAYFRSNGNNHKPLVPYLNGNSASHLSGA